MLQLPADIQNNLPNPIWEAYNVFNLEHEDQPFRRVHRLIDLIEVVCKTYTAASLATFMGLLKKNVQFGGSNLNEDALTKIKVMIGAGLATPSLGIWWAFARDITGILSDLKIPHILPGAEYELLNKKSVIKKAFDGENNLITFRNFYAHGATPNDEQCKEDLATYWPIVHQLLIKAHSLQTVTLVIFTEKRESQICKGATLHNGGLTFDGQPGHVWFVSSEEYADAYPILNFRRTGGKIDFYFYNDLKEKYANYLNYPNATRIKGADLRSEIIKHIPFEDWKKIEHANLEQFRQHIEMLTEIFKGRTNEIDYIANYLAGPDRFLCIWGGPGVGKSALLARVTQILQYRIKGHISLTTETKWPEREIFVIEYFFRRGSTDTAHLFFDSINQRLDLMFGLRYGYGKTEQEKQALFEMRIQQISNQLKSDCLLLIVADGLDEIKNGDLLLGLLPRFLPEKIKIIYGARPQQELRYTFFDQLDRERRSSLELGGLSVADIRAILMEHVSKYDIQNQYVEEVLRLSQGNPLYLKMLCRGLEQNIYNLNFASSLPTGMKELYENALIRLEKESQGSINFLIFIAAAKDFVSPYMVASWMQLNSIHVTNNLLFACLEFLFPQSAGSVNSSYQLFHESLREFLIDNYAFEFQTSVERICDWSLKWRINDRIMSTNSELLLYSMRFSLEHLYESYIYHKRNGHLDDVSQRRSNIFSLMDDDTWRTLNFETCGSSEALSRGYYFQQKILAVDDVEGVNFNQFIEYSYKRYSIGIEMYLRQKDVLKRKIPIAKEEASFQRIAAIAKMGELSDDKILLSLLPIWFNDTHGPIPDQLKEKIEEWLKTSRNNSVKKLWELTKNFVSE